MIPPLLEKTHTNFHLMTGNVEQLKAEAKDRWGEKWTIETTQWADGDSRSRALSSFGRQREGGPIRREQMMIAPDEEVTVERLLVYPEEVVERERIE